MNNPNELKTYQQWNAEGRQVRFGQRAISRSASREGLFDISQTKPLNTRSLFQGVGTVHGFHGDSVAASHAEHFEIEIEEKHQFMREFDY